MGPRRRLGQHRTDGIGERRGRGNRHSSCQLAEAGHRRLLERLGKTPLLDLGLRLGEASGAALALGILRGALATHTGMATFAEASVSGRL